MSATTKNHIDTHVVGGERTDEPELSTDVFHLLQNNRRRSAIRYLRDTDEPVEMRDLAEQVAAWENDTTVQALTAKERQCAYIPLYQSHFPKLDDEGVIEYEQARGIVEKTPVASQLEQYLTLGRNPDIEPNDESRGWDMYLLGDSSLASLLFVGAAFRLPFSTLVPVLVAATILLTALWAVLTDRSVSA